MKQGIDTYNGDIGELDNIIIRHSDAINSPNIKDMFEWWASFAPDLPCRGDFDIIDHLHNAANIFLIEVVGLGEYQFRICGEEVVQIVGVNNNGNLFKHIESPIEERERRCNQLINYYNQIVVARHSKASRGNIHSMRRVSRSFESIDCPLTDKNGTVTHIVGMIEILPS